MEFSTIENCAVHELLQGYKLLDGHWLCLWCDKLFGSEEAVIDHLCHAHSKEKQLDILLGADSLLKLSSSEKAFHKALFADKDQKAVAEKLRLNYNTVRFKRAKLFSEMQSCKLKLMIYNILFAEQPKRIYKKRSRKETVDSQIPYYDEKSSNVTGFADNKEQLHSDPSLSSFFHPTTLILVVKVLNNGEVKFLVCDKAEFAMDVLGEFRPERKAYDCLGGHVEARDMKDCDTITSDDFFRCACRELAEELYLRKYPIAGHEKLKYLFNIRFKSHIDSTKTARYNNELSYVYLYSIPYETDARVREEYIDSLGMTVRLEYPTKLLTYSELLCAFSEAENFCDGLGRIISYFLEHPDMYEKIEKLAKESVFGIPTVK